MANGLMRAMMYGFGSSEQDENGEVALKSKATLEAIKYVKALYEEAMTKDVLTWDVAVERPLHAQWRGLPDPRHGVLPSREREHEPADRR